MLEWPSCCPPKSKDDHLNHLNVPSLRCRETVFSPAETTGGEAAHRLGYSIPETEPLSPNPATSRSFAVSSGNLRSTANAWWAWEDSNFQPNGYCRETGEPGRSHSASFDHRRRPETLRTAMAMAFFCPTNTTSC